MNYQELKDRTSIVEVAVRLGIIKTVRDTTQVFKCFYHEDRSPSCIIMPTANRYKCQSCDKGGDIFDLVQNKLNLSSPLEAAKWLDPTFGDDGWEKETPDTWLKSHPLSEKTQSTYKFKILDSAVSFEIPGYGIKTRQFGEKRKTFGKFHNPTGSADNFVFITIPENEVQFVVEGELDAMVLTDKTGYSAATKTTGAASAKALSEKLAGKEVFIVTDSDDTGKRYATKISTEIPNAKVVTLPQGIKDLSEFFYRNFSKDDFDKLVIQASLPEPPVIVVKTGYPVLDQILGGFESGGQYIFAGEEKSGKTSLVLSFIKNFVEQGNPVVYISTEMKQYEVDKYLDSITGDNNWCQKHEGFQLCDFEELLSLEEHLKLVENKAKIGNRIFVIDNLTSYMDDLKLGKHEWERISNASAAYKRLAMKLGLLVITVIHLNKGTILREIPIKVKKMLEENEPGRIFSESVTVFRKPDIEDIKGGSGMRSQTKGQILLWRPFQSFYLPKFNKLCSVIVANNHGGPTGDVRFEFDGATKRFTEVETSIPIENETYQAARNIFDPNSSYQTKLSELS